MYNYNHLYYFYMTVKSGSITSAAKHLCISQPALSSQLKVLEDYLEIKLFNKDGRTNKITPEGALIYGFCRQMFELAEEMHESISERIPYASRRLYIGVSNEIANSFVVETVSHFLQKYSDPLRPKIMMISGSHQQLFEQIRFREIDAVVTQQAMINPELENLQRVEVPVNLVCSVKNKSLTENTYANIHSTLNDLSGNAQPQWVMPSTGFQLRSEINYFLEENSLSGRIVFESDVMESLTRSVVDDIGIAFLPLVYVPKEIENKLLYRFGPETGLWKHRIFLVSHSKNKNDHLIKSLSDSFLAVSNALNV